MKEDLGGKFMAELTKFAIYGLWGERNYRLEFDNEKLIIVGENGSGKTTVLRILYYCLSCNWNALQKEEFEKIQITFGEETKEITHDQIENSGIYKITKDWEDYALNGFRYRVKEKYDKYLSRRNILEILQELDFEGEYNHETAAFINKLKKEIPVAVQEFAEWIHEKLKYRLIYYPTYRRFENSEQKSKDKLNSNTRKENRHLIISHSEMTYVDEMIMESINLIHEEYNKSSAELNLNCFKGILKHDFEQIAEITADKSDPEYIETVFYSMSGAALPQEDMLQIKDKLLNILEKDTVDEEYDKIVVYFYIMLVKRFEELKKKEERLERFFYACNRYLCNKQFLYNPNNFTYCIQVGINTDLKKNIKINQLSSGEKQIVALFCYLYLDETNDKFIIIDEPELSLSIDWQERILDDVIHIPTCKALLVATQSPFVYNNSLHPYARDIEEFLTLE